MLNQILHLLQPTEIPGVFAQTMDTESHRSCDAQHTLATDLLLSNYISHEVKPGFQSYDWTPRKGKPVVTRGRKASALKRFKGRTVAERS